MHLHADTCAGSGIGKCCVDDCESAAGNCYCDSLCYFYGNCCEDTLCERKYGCQTRVDELLNTLYCNKYYYNHFQLDPPVLEVALPHAVLNLMSAPDLIMEIATVIISVFGMGTVVMMPFSSDAGRIL